MEEKMEHAGMLDLITRPAFCVKEGAITKVNESARRRMIDPGTPVADLLATGAEEYRQFQDGCLYLRLCIAGCICGASVTRMGEADVFVLESEEDQAELQAMALAAQQLRLPLANVMLIADALPSVSVEDADPAFSDQVAQMSRGLYQLQRIIYNMSDAYRYCLERTPRMEIRNIRSLLDELIVKTQPLVSQAEIELRFTLPREDIYCLVDEEKLERAVNNMISNAMKFTKRGEFILGQMTRRENTLYITVQDNGSGIAPELKGSIHARYLREPGIEDGRYGIGLGMVIIRAAAAAHGGTVLIQHPKDAGTRITMAIPIRQDPQNSVHSDMLRVDYAGEHDHQLLELSESLPASAYRNQN